MDKHLNPSALLKPAIAGVDELLAQTIETDLHYQPVKITPLPDGNAFMTVVERDQVYNFDHDLAVTFYSDSEHLPENGSASLSELGSIIYNFVIEQLEAKGLQPEDEYITCTTCHGEDEDCDECDCNYEIPNPHFVDSYLQAADLMELCDELGLDWEGAFAVSKPLYLYNHSGVTINTTGFSCRWDSSQIGFVAMTHEQAKEFEGYPRTGTDLFEQFCESQGLPRDTPYERYHELKGRHPQTDGYKPSLEMILDGQVATVRDVMEGNVHGYNQGTVELKDLPTLAMKQVTNELMTVW